MHIIKLTPYFSERIWGGNKFHQLGFNPNHQAKIGEAWLISAHQNGMTYLQTDPQTSFETFYLQNPTRFNYAGNQQYPLLTKIISAEDNLSVQVHPDDAYGLAHHNDLGKPEAWYVLDCPSDAKIIYGHEFKDQKSFSEALACEDWAKILRYVPIKKGDFIYVPTGKIHAITSGVTVLEIQRSSDITYRLYDFDRVDEQNNKRRLDLVDAVNCISFPDEIDTILTNFNEQVFSCPFFSATKLDIDGVKSFKLDPSYQCLQVCVIGGAGKINNQDFIRWESGVVVDYQDQASLEFVGKMQVILSWI